MPRRTIWCARKPTSDVSKNRISPASGSINPLMVRSSVVFPAPFDPMSVTISPRSICNDTECSALIAPYETSRLSIFSSISLHRFSEIRLDHLGMTLYFLRRSHRDRFAVLPHRDTLADGHNDLR